MNWLLVSIIAQIVLGTSAVFDKILLRKRFTDPWAYTFWASVLGMFIVVLIPFFGFYSVPLNTILVAILSGAIFSLAILFFFWALKDGEASVALPVIGGLAPFFTLLIGIPLLQNSITAMEFPGFALLVLGSFLILGAERREFRLHIFTIAFLGAVFFGLSNVLAKLVFEASPFVTGMVWQRLGSALMVLAFLLVPGMRARIVRSFHETRASSGILYLINRTYAALGAVLVSGAIFLAHPALVDASGALKYAVIFLGAWLILRETFRGRTLALKVSATLLIILGIMWLGFASYIQNYPAPDNGRQISWGITFSQKASLELGLDWRENYNAILSELEPDGLRLIAYWDIVEPEDDRWDFEDLDWQISEAERAGIPIILAVGQKVPRWPECHIPAWAREIQKSNIKNQNEKYAGELLEYLETVVRRYRDRPGLLYWQVENEPFLFFGECPRSFVVQSLDEEIALVKKLDPVHPILTTDGGEAGDWYRTAKRGDVFGTTLYRKVHNDILGYFTYPLPPGFYPWKESVARRLSGKPEQKYIVAELGLEPWLEKGLSRTTPEEQLLAFGPGDFEDTIEYAKAAGFDTYYMWGAEWWYEMKTAHNDPRFWDAAKSTIKIKEK